MSLNQMLDDSVLELYSRKIFGFALSKTAHEQNAKDLSQEILFALYRSLRNGTKVDNMDAWVHTICCYTWSNFLAKEKRHWENVDLDNVLSTFNNSDANDSEQEQMIGKLRSEVAYLSRLHRDITVKFYYEKQSVQCIAQHLKIPAGTVKWHLFEVRKKLKEGLKVKYSAENLSYKPIRMMVGHSGTPGPNNEPNCYFDSLLISNICVAMYEKPLTIEEIARNIGVANAYIEDEIVKLEKSELVRHVGKGKYQTNFIIETMESLAAYVTYFRAKAEVLAENIFDSIAAKLNDIRELQFYGHHANENFLLWTLIPYAIWDQYYQVKDRTYYAQYQPEERKDGGKYIVNASIIYSEEEYQRKITNYESVRKYGTNGIKQRNSGNVHGLQLESWWSGMSWREFDSSDLAEMARVVEIIESNDAHNDHDKLIISKLVEKGFVAIDGNKSECLIPFLNKSQHEKLTGIIGESFSSIHAKEMLEEIHEDMIAMWRKVAPTFVSNKEIVYKAIVDGTTIIFAVMEYLERKGKLRLPVDQEKKRLMTILWSMN